MALKFAPKPGEMVLCDYATGFQPPEMVKRRPALVVSPPLLHRDSLCTVVPLSTSPPAAPVPYQCELTLPVAPPAPFSARRVWAKADMLATVAYRRLDLFRTQRGPDGRRSYVKVRVSPADLARVRACAAYALGL